MNRIPKLFNDKSRPVLEQIIELAKHLEHPPETIEKIREEFKKGNIDFVTNFAQTLTMQFIGNCIMEAVDEDE